MQAPSRRVDAPELDSPKAHTVRWFVVHGPLARSDSPACLLKRRSGASPQLDELWHATDYGFMYQRQRNDPDGIIELQSSLGRSEAIGVRSDGSGSDLLGSARRPGLRVSERHRGVKRATS